MHSTTAVMKHECQKTLTFTTIPLGICLSTTQLLVLLVACPPGPDPLTNCSSRSSSFRIGRSNSPFLPAAKTHGSPGGRGILGDILGEPLQKTRLDTLFTQPMMGKSRDIPLHKQYSVVLSQYFSSVTVNTKSE